MESGGMLKQLLDKFQGEQQLLDEERTLVTDQISQLEARLEECLKRRELISVDKEKVSAMMQRYLHGQFVPPPEVLAKLQSGEYVPAQVSTPATPPAPAAPPAPEPAAVATPPVAPPVTPPTPVQPVAPPQPAVPPKPPKPEPVQEVPAPEPPPVPVAPEPEPIPEPSPIAAFFDQAAEAAAAPPPPGPLDLPTSEILKPKGITAVPARRKPKPEVPVPEVQQEVAPPPPPQPVPNAQDTGVWYQEEQYQYDQASQNAAAGGGWSEEEQPAAEEVASDAVEAAADELRSGDGTVDLGGQQGEEADSETVKSINDALRSLFKL